MCGGGEAEGITHNIDQVKSVASANAIPNKTLVLLGKKIKALDILHPY